MRFITIAFMPSDSAHQRLAGHPVPGRGKERLVTAMRPAKKIRNLKAAETTSGD
jgi:hypothetical protein